MAAEEAEGVGDVRWRERAVERSLRSARAKAESRSERFITAAMALLNETGRMDFTVQEIVERSKMSLRSFYQHFASKDELLLALFEEAIRTYINRLHELVDDYADPVDQLQVYITGLYGAVEDSAGPGAKALAIYHLQLAEAHPSEFAHALAPQIELLSEIVESGVATGQFRQDIEPAQLVMILSQSLVSALHMSVLGIHLTGEAVAAEHLWAFCLGGVSPPVVPPKRRVARPAPPSRRAAPARRPAGAKRR